MLLPYGYFWVALFHFAALARLCKPMSLFFYKTSWLLLPAFTTVVVLDGTGLSEDQTSFGIIRISGYPTPLWRLLFSWLTFRSLGRVSLIAKYGVFIFALGIPQPRLPAGLDFGAPIDGTSPPMAPIYFHSLIGRCLHLVPSLVRSVWCPSCFRSPTIWF